MPVGRPLKFTPDELCNEFKKYKDAQKGHVKQVYDAKRKQVIELQYDKPLTLTGFCVFAGIHRDTLNEYKNNREEFSDTIQKIYASVEAELLEKALTYDQHAAFTIHLLNNAHGYITKTASELTGPGGGPLLVEALTTEQLRERARKMLEEG